MKHGLVCHQIRRFRSPAHAQRLFARRNERSLHMSRAASAFKQSDVTRAARAVVNAGLKVSGIKIAANGEIRIDVLTSDAPSTVITDSFAEWKDRRDARRSQGNRHGA
jgi:hypothetical protein